MTPSGRRPINKAGGSNGAGGKPAGSTSGKQVGSPKPTSPSGRRPAPAGSRPPAGARPARGRPDADDEEHKPTAAKQFMFFGTIALVIIVIILFVAKWDVITKDPPPPPKKVVIDHGKILDEVASLQGKANDQYKAACKHKDGASRNKGIHAALETLGEALAKVAELQDRPEYKDNPDYDLVFNEKTNKIQRDMKVFRDTIRMGD